MPFKDVHRTCPNCGLINPPEAERCDCGFDFKSKTVKDSYLTEKQARKEESGVTVAIAQANRSPAKLVWGIIMFGVAAGLWVYMTSNEFMRFGVMREVLALTLALTGLWHIIDYVRAGKVLKSQEREQKRATQSSAAPRAKSGPENISDLMYDAGILDHRGDWDEAIAIYRKIQSLGDTQQSEVAENHIARIEAKKAAAGV